MRNLKRPKTVATFGREETDRERKMKAVQVDKKTWIMVSVETPDQEARERFILNQEENRRKFENHKDFFKWQ
jgi:hypothetical protein